VVAVALFVGSFVLRRRVGVGIGIEQRRKARHAGGVVVDSSTALLPAHFFLR
jgi:hypothetical protein